jgi:hypothetical protein
VLVLDQPRQLPHGRLEVALDLGTGDPLGDPAADPRAGHAVGEPDLDPRTAAGRRPPRWSTPVIEFQASSRGLSHSTISIRPPTSAEPTRISIR